MEPRNQKQIPRNIAHTGNPHGQKGRGGIAHATKDGANQVVGNKGNHPAAADTNIGNSLHKRGFRRVHGSRNLDGEQRNRNGQRRPDGEKKRDTGPDNLSAPFRVAHANLMSEINRGSHGKTADEIPQCQHNLGTGGDRRHVLRRGKFAHHQQIHRAVHSL